MNVDLQEIQPTASHGDETPTSGNDAAGGSSKKKGRKKYVVLGTVAVVVVLAAVGFLVWHNQPSFCNAICHYPMDRYVEEYYAQDSMLLAAKHGNSGVACLDCHTPELSEQMAEGIAWLQGNFAMDDEGFIAGKMAVSANSEFCYTCHNDGDSSTGKDWEDIIATTEDWGGRSGVNPHSSHNGVQECSDCHSSHRTSTMECNTCHGWAVPEGWQQPKLF